MSMGRFVTNMKVPTLRSQDMPNFSPARNFILGR